MTETTSTEMTVTRSAKPRTKTRYIRDPENKERVLTLVTKIDGQNLSFAVAVNSPSRYVSTPVEGGTLTVDGNTLPVGGGTLTTFVPGDQFCRRTGSLIAHRRLECARTVHTMAFNSEAQHPLTQALVALSVSPNLIVSRIARQELLRLRTTGSKALAADTRAA